MNDPLTNEQFSIYLTIWRELRFEHDADALNMRNDYLLWTRAIQMEWFTKLHNGELAGNPCADKICARAVLERLKK